MIYQEAEKYIKEQFASKSYDGARSTLKIAEIIGDKLLADQTHKDGDYHAPKPGVVHASKLYGCLRGTFYEMMGVKKDVQEEFNARRMAGVFEAGNLFEDFIVNSLGDRVLEKQREYIMKYKSLTLTGHSDYRVLDGDIMRIGENKSVHSQAFWYRQQEGTLVAWQNQIQLQVYLWCERVLFNNEWEGIFSYISKDDCTIDSIPVKYNPEIINEVVIPILDLLNAAYEEALPFVGQPNYLEKILEIGQKLPAPDMAVYDANKHTYSVNWIAKYCNHHCSCAGAGWLLEAGAEVKRKNAESKASLVKSIGGTVEKTEKPVIGIAAE